MPLMLRVAGSDVAVERVQQAFDVDRVAATWRKGDQLRRGVAASAGLNIVLSDEEEPQDAFAEAERVLAEVSQVIKTLELSISLQVSVPLFVHAMRTASVVIPASFVGVASEGRAEIAIRAYPCSDD